MIRIKYERDHSPNYAVIDTRSNKTLYRDRTEDLCQRWIDGQADLFYLVSVLPWSNYADVETPWSQTVRGVVPMT